MGEIADNCIYLPESNPHAEPELTILWDETIKTMSSSVVFSVFMFTAGALFAQAPAGVKGSAPASPAVKKPSTAKAPAARKSAVKPAPPAASPAAVAAPGSDKVVITVGQETITAKQFDEIVDALPEQYKAQARGPMKRQMAEQIASVKLLAQEAKKRGLDKDAALQARLKLQEDNLLAGAAFNDIVKNTPVDDAALQKQYEARKSEYETAEARHILIKFKGSPVPSREGQKELTEEEALAKVQEIRKRLLAGEDFAEIAKKESDDAGSGANGGSLGNFGRGQMVPAFEEAAFKLPLNQVSEPIKTQFGYHLIRVDKRDAKSFEQVREELAGKMKPDMAKVSVDKMRESQVKLDDTFFGPATPVAPAPGSDGSAAPPPPPAPAK